MSYIRIPKRLSTDFSDSWQVRRERHDISKVLEEKSATITLSADVSDDVLKQAVIDAGYEVVSLD